MTASVVADTSAWVEYLRGTGSSVHLALAEAMRERRVVVVGPVLMEVLEGARDAEEWSDLRRLLASCNFARMESHRDWVEAAALRRRMRRAGRAVASKIDCLTAVVAIRIDAAVLHRDADFDAIAEVAPLRIA